MEHCLWAHRTAATTEEDTAKNECFPGSLCPLPPMEAPLSQAETSWAAGTACFTDTVSDPHNALLGRYCYYLPFTDEVIEAQEDLLVAGARWHRE